MPTRPRGDQAVHIAATLREEILSGVLPPGTALGQEDIAKRFSISRIPVREALRLLERDGLASIIANKGARVTPLTIEDLNEISEMRIASETLALSRAVPNLSNAHLDQAAEVQTRLEGAPSCMFGPLNAEFHRILYAPAKRPRLLAHIETLSLLSERYLRRVTETLDHSDQSHREHHMILSACNARDTDHAVATLTDHIKKAADALRQQMRDLES